MNKPIIDREEAIQTVIKLATRYTVVEYEGGWLKGTSLSHSNAGRIVDALGVGQEEDESGKWPNSHREIPSRYFPKDIGPGGFDIVMMRAYAKAINEGYSHEMSEKSWVILYLLDRFEAAEKLEAQAKDLLAAWDMVNDPDPEIRVAPMYSPMGKLRNLLIELEEM